MLPTGKYDRRNVVVKGTLALITALVIAAFAIPAFVSYIQRDDPPESDDRPLVVVSVDPSPVITGIVARWQVEKDQDLALTFFVSADEDSNSPVLVSVIVASDDVRTSDVKCDGRNTAYETSFGELAAGPRRAAEADKRSRDANSTGAFRNSDIDATRASVNAQYLYPRGWTLDNRRTLKPSPGEIVRCTISRHLVWKGSEPTLLGQIPELDVVHSDASNMRDGRTRLFLDMTYTRTPGTFVSESYPELSGFGSGMYAEVGRYFTDDGRLIFSALPTVIVEKRDAARADNVMLAFTGIALGTAGALLIYVLDLLYEFTIGRWLTRKAPRV